MYLLSVHNGHESEHEQMHKARRTRRKEAAGEQQRASEKD